MFTKTQIVTPEQARQWLDTKNLHNRPMSQRTVDRYAQEMKAGRWKLNGEAIIFVRQVRQSTKRPASPSRLRSSPGQNFQKSMASRVR